MVSAFNRVKFAPPSVDSIAYGGRPEPRVTAPPLETELTPGRASHPTVERLPSTTIDEMERPSKADRYTRGLHYANGGRTGHAIYVPRRPRARSEVRPLLPPSVDL